MTDTPSFGQRTAALSSLDERLDLERVEQRRSEFAAIDVLIEDFLRRALAGQRVVEFIGHAGNERVNLGGFDDDAAALVADQYDLSAIESRGAWGVPSHGMVDGRILDFAWWVRGEPQLIAGSAGAIDRATIGLLDHPAAVFAWAVLGPLFDVFAPQRRSRATNEDQPRPELRVELWARVESITAALGLQLTGALADYRMNFRPSSKFATAGERARAHGQIADLWAQQITTETAAKLRVWMIAKLINGYYAKAKWNRPTSRQVVTNLLLRPFVAFFRGDWLAFLRYLGEEPAPTEQIITTLPKPRLYVDAPDRAYQLAETIGVDAAEVQRIVASLWGGAGTSSPIERRIVAMERVWEVVDTLHADEPAAAVFRWDLMGHPDAHHRELAAHVRHLAQELLPFEVNSEIEELWGTCVDERFPDGVVTCKFPHAACCEAFGPALAFWDGIALPTLANDHGHYYRARHGRASPDRLLTAMDGLGYPVDPEFFTDLAAAVGSHDAPASQPGSAGTPSNAGGPAGVDEARAVITRHRRAWAREHLRPYLHARWQTDLHPIADAYNRMLLSSPRPPTPKQIIATSKVATDRWFGGDIQLLLIALGEKTSSSFP
jgi:hypothetical protein